MTQQQIEDLAKMAKATKGEHNRLWSLSGEMSNPSATELDQQLHATELALTVIATNVKTLRMQLKNA